MNVCYTQMAITFLGKHYKIMLSVGWGDQGQCEAVVYPGILFRGGVNKFSSGERAERTGNWGRQSLSQGFHSICKWVKPIFLLVCYRFIFHRTGNSAQLCQNFGILGVLNSPPPIHHWCEETRNQVSVGIKKSTGNKWMDTEEWKRLCYRMIIHPVRNNWSWWWLSS
jgi:hypothetical protein